MAVYVSRRSLVASRQLFIHRICACRICQWSANADASRCLAIAVATCCHNRKDAIAEVMSYPSQPAATAFCDRSLFTISAFQYFHARDFDLKADVSIASFLAFAARLQFIIAWRNFLLAAAYHSPLATSRRFKRLILVKHTLSQFFSAARPRIVDQAVFAAASARSLAIWSQV